MTFSFENKVALVTGAGSGIGLATAKAFAEAGAAVVLADRDERSACFAADELAAVGHNTLAMRCDVSDEKQVAAMVGQVASKFGGLDAACNNAGIHVPRAETADATGEDLRNPPECRNRGRVCGKASSKRLEITGNKRNARFSTQSHPVGFALEAGSMRVARCRQVWLLACAYLWPCGLSVGDAMGMVFLEVLTLMFDLRHAVGCGENFPIDFRLPQSTAIACHRCRSRAEVLSRFSFDALGL